MEKLKFDAVDGRLEIGQIADGIEHLGFRFIRQPQNDMDDDGQTGGFQFTDGIFKDREGITALDARGTFLMDGLKSQFHPDRFSAV